MTAPESIESAGPTVDQAIEQGLAQLGLSRDDVEVEVLDEGSRGLLGLGARDALVRLTPRPVVAPGPPPQPVRAKPRTQRRAGAAEAELTPTPEEAEDVDVARGALQDLLDHMRVKATIKARRAEPSSEDDAPPWVLDIQGQDLGILIGRRGETLNALQYITRLICNRELQRRANIVVDVQGYKSRREVALRNLAERMAGEAYRRARTVTLEPMPPNERRIVHLALRDDPHVTTESVGVGDKRKVTIIPVDRPRR
jgi:spoIIIJ-associated protein